MQHIFIQIYLFTFCLVLGFTQHFFCNYMIVKYLRICIYIINKDLNDYMYSTVVLRLFGPVNSRKRCLRNKYNMPDLDREKYSHFICATITNITEQKE